MPAVSTVRVKLNKAIVEGLEPPEPPADRQYIYDSVTPGLALCITAGSAKTFYLYRRIAGRPERVRLGKFPQMTVEQARKAADKKNGEIAEGKNPAEEKRAVRASMTFGDLWAFYLTSYAKPRKKSWKTDEWLYKRFLAPWQARRLNEIKRGDVQILHATLGQTSVTNANRTRSLLSKMFNVAGDGGYEGENPVSRTKPFPEVKRERFLSSEEVKRFFEALGSEPNKVLADALRFGLWTGARRGNWLSARWDEIDLARKVWTIPADKTKANRPIVIPLGAPALDILRRRKSTKKVSSEWVFPGRRGGHATTAKFAWERICKAAKIENARMHDLRRTMATFAVNAGVPIFHVAKLLGHKTTTVTESVYAQSQDAALRNAVDLATAAMTAVIKKPKVKKAKGGKGNGKA